MADEVVEGAGSPAAEELAPESAPAGAENTETQPASEQARIPKARLDEVIAQRNSEKAEKERLQAELAELKKTAKPAETAGAGGEDEDDSPPQGLTQRQQVRWYIERDSERLIKQKLGMGLEEAASLLRSTKPAGEYYARRQWQDLCSARGLDPESTEIQETAAAFIKGLGMEVEAAMDKTAKLHGGKSGDEKVRARVETKSITGTGTKDSIVPKDRHEAAALAAKGVAAKRETIEEILARRRAAN